MHWQTEQEKQALRDWRADMRRERQLRKELLELKQVAHRTDDHRQFKWALQMIKSIEHELHQLQS
jgi:hypothetical protein